MSQPIPPLSAKNTAVPEARRDGVAQSAANAACSAQAEGFDSGGGSGDDSGLGGIGAGAGDGNDGGVNGGFGVSGPNLASCCHGGGEADVDPGIQEDSDLWAKQWLKIAIAIVFGGQGMIFGLGLNRADPRLEPDNPVYWVLHGGLFLSALVAFVLLGPPMVRNAWEALRQRRFSVETLFLLSAFGAMVASLINTFTGHGNVYYEIVAIVLAIYSIGKLLGARSRARAVAAARALSDEFEYAYIDTCCGSRRRMAVADMAPGMSVLVGPGEPVAVDGVISRGEGFVIETAMTGETAPVLRRAGQSVWAGSYSVDGTFAIEAVAVKGARRLDAVLETIIGAQLRPSRLQRQSDRLMTWFVPFVVTVSLSSFVAWSFLTSWQAALFNAMAVLLVACPCAVGLATPIAVWSTLVNLSRAGLVARTGDFCDALATARRIVFDKTGTISAEELQVHGCLWLEPQRAEFFQKLVAAAESVNTHPVARALATLGTSAEAQTNAEAQADASRQSLHQASSSPHQAQSHPLEVVSVETVAGRGIRAQVCCEGTLHRVEIGQPELFSAQVRERLERVPRGAAAQQAKREVWVSVDGGAAGIVFLSEALRAHVAASLGALRADGVEVTILSGDPEPLWEEVGGVSVRAGLSPLQKEALVRQWTDAGEQVIFVGDGVNDASAMTTANASIAMSTGAELTRASATAVLVAPTLEPIVRGRAICQAMRRTLRGNMIFALVYNVIGMTLAAFGVLNPVVAALLMLFSSVMVSFRATRSANRLLEARA